MNAGDDRHPAGAGEPLDERDFVVLRGVREVYEAIDPMPADLLDNIRFAISLREMEFELEIAGVAAAPLPVVTRGDDEQRLITFECPSMSIAVAIRINDDGTARVDGWLTPPGAHTVELRLPEALSTTESDERGRFALDHLPRTTAYLTVRTGVRVVTTPTIRL